MVAGSCFTVGSTNCDVGGSLVQTFRGQYRNLVTVKQYNTIESDFTVLSSPSSLPAKISQTHGHHTGRPPTALSDPPRALSTSHHGRTGDGPSENLEGSRSVAEEDLQGGRVREVTSASRDSRTRTQIERRVSAGRGLPGDSPAIYTDQVQYGELRQYREK
jgi:hypothetical protein